ncbi:MAG: TonB-dependent receptor [Parvularculaceae bacterium]
MLRLLIRKARAGGVNNANQPFAPGIPATFGSDNLTNWEGGIKSRLFGNTLQVNTSVFFIDWNNIQVEPRDPAGNIPFTTNGGDAQIRGAEWALEWAPADRWNFSFSGDYFFKSELSTDQPVLPGASPFVIVGLAGDRIPNVPKLQFYASANYEASLFGKPLFLTTDITHRGSTNTEFRTSSPFNIALDSYTLVDLYARLQVSDRVAFGIYAKNVTNSLGVVDGIGTFQDPQAIIATRPRTMGATISFKY